jgi:hypothetical protein
MAWLDASNGWAGAKVRKDIEEISRSTRTDYVLGQLRAVPRWRLSPLRHGQKLDLRACIGMTEAFQGHLLKCVEVTRLPKSQQQTSGNEDAFFAWY